MKPSARSPVDVVIKARSRELGGLKIRRLLPSRHRQRVGPFIFLDHIGPETLQKDHGFDVLPHPHIGLATVTYLFEGDLVHRDSQGFVETIRPGEVNWMHAGRGVVHSERSGPAERRQRTRIHGLQLWAALPSESEDTPPRFHHYTSDSLPVWSEPGLEARILAGEAWGQSSPVVTASPTLLVDVKLGPEASFRVPDAPERGLYIVEGQALVNGVAELESGVLAVLSSGPQIDVVARSPLRLAVLGGAPLGGERHIWWNFVSSSPERIERAKRDWLEHRFPPVPGDTDQRAPLPSRGMR